MAASPTDAQPIFDLIATRARDICGSYGVSVFEFDGAMMHLREPLQRDVFRMSVRACCLDRIKSGAAPAIDERHRFAIVSRNWRDVGFG
jgi:hypothetical protein